MHRHARKCLGQAGLGGGGGGREAPSPETVENDNNDNKILTLELSYGDVRRASSRVTSLDNTSS